MNTLINRSILKTSLIAMALSAGVATASADPVLDQLASSGSIITTHGIGGPR